jgi:hypothetical protein
MFCRVIKLGPIGDVVINLLGNKYGFSLLDDKNR